MGGKWLQLLKEIAPSVTRAAVIRDATTTGGVGSQFAEAMAPSLGVEAVAVNTRSSAVLRSLDGPPMVE